MLEDTATALQELNGIKTTVPILPLAQETVQLMVFQEKIGPIHMELNKSIKELTLLLSLMDSMEITLELEHI